MMAHREMVVAVAAEVKKMVADGKSQQEVLAAKLTTPFDSKVVGGGTPAGNADRFVTQVYTQMKAGK